MPESKRHKDLKRQEARTGRTEVTLRSGLRVDAMTRRRAVEIERSESSRSFEKAIRRLQSTRKTQRILRVPDQNLDMAADVARDMGADVTITNFSKTRRRNIRR